jgi:dissimilatory sulfite reductase (desulfoviridin) alpha/beta subunit
VKIEELRELAFLYATPNAWMTAENIHQAVRLAETATDGELELATRIAVEIRRQFYSDIPEVRP